MKQQKSGLPQLSPSPLAGLRLPFTSRPAQSDDPIDTLVHTLGDSLDMSELDGAPRAPEALEKQQAPSIWHSLTSSFAGLFPRAKLQAGQPVDVAIVNIEESEAVSGVQAAAERPPLQHDAEVEIAPKKFSLATFFQRLKPAPKAGKVAKVKIQKSSKEEDDALATAAKGKSKAGLPMRMILIAGISTLGLLVAGFFIFGAVTHRPHANAALVAKAETTKTEATKTDVAKLATPDQLLAPAQLTAMPKLPRRPGDTKHLHTVVVSEGMAMQPSEVVVPDQGDTSETDMQSDKKVIAQIRPQIKHLCGLEVNKVIAWNYRDGYLFCHIKNRTADASNLLQRSPNGDFTFIGGSIGLMTLEEMNETFLVDSDTARILLRHMNS